MRLTAAAITLGLISTGPAVAQECPAGRQPWSTVVAKQPDTSIYAQLSEEQAKAIAEIAQAILLPELDVSVVADGYLAMPFHGSPTTWIFFLDDTQCSVAWARGDTRKIARWFGYTVPHETAA